MINADTRQHFIADTHAILQRIFGTRYLLFATAVHLAVLAALGTWIVGRTPTPPPVFGTTTVFSPQEPVVHPPELNKPIEELTPDKSQEARSRRTDPGPLTPSSGRELIATTGGGSSLPSGYGLKFDVGPTGPSHLPEGVGIQASARHLDPRYGKVRDFQRFWGVTGPLNNPRATFTCYLGKYADGDWNCNPTALENMLTQVVRWSKERIQASAQPEAIALSSEEMFKTHPPFIFLTGHKDFHFTDQEVENLREYLLIGGSLWIDNSLPGRRSRFDEAVRREMRRVFPDREFESVPQNHELFHSFFHIRDVPSGMNQYAEPIEHVRLGDESVVIYTQNAYSDLWETALDENDQIDTDTYLNEDTGQTYTKWGPHWGNYLTGFLYRNVDETSIRDANRLALNIIVHLLTQYEDKFRMIGKL